MTQRLGSEHLLAIMPRLPAELRNRYVVPFQAALTEFDITTAPRMAAHLAQIAHESSELRQWKEIWGPTEDQKRYEPPHQKATGLGNVKPGDGFRFRGRGPIQITGRYNYRLVGKALGVDLEDEPDRALDPDVGFRIAGYLWRLWKLNAMADGDRPEDFITITRKINGGLNGLAERQRYYARARIVFGLPLHPAE